MMNFDITVRVGCRLLYEVTDTASLFLNLKLHWATDELIGIDDRCGSTGCATSSAVRNRPLRQARDRVTLTGW